MVSPQADDIFFVELENMVNQYDERLAELRDVMSDVDLAFKQVCACARVGVWVCGCMCVAPTVSSSWVIVSLDLAFFFSFSLSCSACEK